MALIMICYYYGAYNDVVRMIVFLASTAMATFLFASLMADSGIIVERFPLGSGSFLTDLKKRYSDNISLFRFTTW